jgi:hypothetical protein
VLSELGHDVARRIKAATPVARRRQLVALRFGLRFPTASRRVLPDSLIIGAQRCGTSSLYKLLGRHPDVVPSLRKEVEFFSVRYGEGINWYRAHFPLNAGLAVSARLRGRRPITFEATPDYLLDPRAAERAAAHLPEARIIILVRDPIDRAFSQYRHNRRLGHEPLGFEDALAAEPERLEGEIERMLDDPTYQARRFRRYSYVTRGLYADQLDRWQKWFARHRILVLRSEEFFEAPAQTYSLVISFLGLAPFVPKRFPNYSYLSPVTDGDANLSPMIRDRLAATFAPHNQRLEAMLGFDLGWDERGSPGSGVPSSHESPPASA